MILEAAVLTHTLSPYQEQFGFEPHLAAVFTCQPKLLLGLLPRRSHMDYHIFRHRRFIEVNRYPASILTLVQLAFSISIMLSTSFKGSSLALWHKRKIGGSPRSQTWYLLSLRDRWINVFPESHVLKN